MCGDSQVTVSVFLAVGINPMSQRQSPGMVESPSPRDNQGQMPPSDGSDPLKQRRIAALFSTFVVVFMVAIVVIPLFYTSFSDELGRWRLAAAWEHRLNGELETAIASLTTALEADPYHVDIYLQRAAWYDQMGDREAALRDYNKVHELAVYDQRMLVGRAMTYHAMGKYAESIGDIKELLDVSSGADRIGYLNLLAYVRGLNNTDLDEALSEIIESIDLDSARRRQVGVFIMNPALLDTRGFIYYQRGDFDAARDDLEVAVKQYSTALKRSERRLRSGVGIVDLRLGRLQLQGEKETLAVIVYHRGLIYERLGKTDLAQVDFDHVRILGFEPNEELY
jgi:tetratricopeptide (TPR) repeat protein